MRRKIMMRVAAVFVAAAVMIASAGTGALAQTVSDGGVAADLSGAVSTSEIAAVVEGTDSNNLSDNNYATYYASNVNSYLMENEDGPLTRVEYISGTGVVAETYASDRTLQSSIVLGAELPLFGGFYAGKDYNFLVFGQKNTEESDECEVMRVVKYSKSWQRVDSCGIYGANTYIPFDAGSLRMTEVNGLLYIYTCHEMYLSSDGYHHQANMTFVLDEAGMEVTQSFYDVMNISWGYVSHSFNQYIQTDGEYVYRVDHGDAYPRAVTLTQCAVGDSITSVYYTGALIIQGTSGMNATGVSVGGFELSANNCLIAGNSVDQSDADTYSPFGQRNIFLTVTDKSLENTETIWLTDYTSGDGITPRTPQLVKVSDDRFLIMWEEYSSSTAEVALKIQAVDGSGKATEKVVTMNARLSDCQPIVTSDGMVKWYVTNDVEIMMYCIDPSDLKDNTDLEVLRSKYTIRAGDSLDYKNVRYKVLNASKATVTALSGLNKKAKTVSIPATVEINGVTCRVVSIRKNAFKGYTRLKKVTIGANVRTIGKKAFYGCKKLKSVVFKGTAVSKVQKGAFGKTGASIKVSTPNNMTAKKRTALRKKLIKAGMNKKVTVK